jgi:hypothetical protein
MRERARPPIHRCLFRGRGRALGGGEGGTERACLSRRGESWEGSRVARRGARGGWRCVPASGRLGWEEGKFGRKEGMGGTWVVGGDGV